MKQPKKKTTEIPQAIYTNQFLRFVSIYAKKFKVQRGFGRWLAEYQYMDEQDMLKPDKLRELYVDILNGISSLSYIYREAVNFICMQAVDAAKAYMSNNSFDIRVITGEIAVNDDDEELTDLSLEEAICICDSMNEEAEEILFKVYNSNANKAVK